MRRSEMTRCAISDHFSLSKGLNSAHFHGTHLPVEEPFAASIADMTGTASIVERRRKLQGLALRGVVIDPEFGVLLRHNVRDALHRSRGLVLVGVD